MVDFRVICTHEDVVNTDAIEVGQYEQGVRGRYAFTALKLRDQCLIDASFHL